MVCQLRLTWSLLLAKETGAPESVPSFKTMSPREVARTYKASMIFATSEPLYEKFNQT